MKILAAAVVFGLMSFVTTIDFNDALVEQERYCQMVSDGLWQDYQGIYLTECGRGE